MSIYDQLRPPGSALLLLLRAAVADAGDEGPWLTAEWSEEQQAAEHRIVVGGEMPATPTRLTLLSGLDVLGYAHHHRWTPAEFTNPTERQLRALAVHAMLHNDVGVWDLDYAAWCAWRSSEQFARERARHDDNARSAARALRWILAEQWLSAR